MICFHHAAQSPARTMFPVRGPYAPCRYRPGQALRGAETSAAREIPHLVWIMLNLRHTKQAFVFFIIPCARKECKRCLEAHASFFLIQTRKQTALRSAAGQIEHLLPCCHDGHSYAGRSEHLGGVIPEDAAVFILRQFHFHQAVNVRLRIPHGIIGAEHHPVRAPLPDQFPAFVPA